jgi:hypothetical protein
MNVYAADNSDSFPIVMAGGTAGAYAQATGSSAGTSTLVDTAISSMYNNGTSSNSAGSVTACWWILVLKSQVSPKQFICKSDPVGASSPASINNSSNAFYLDFQNTTQYSYSSAYPWNASVSPVTNGGWWKNLTDSSLPMMSDMAPQDSTGSNPQEKSAGAGSGPIAGNAKSWNSANHQRDGQNVAFSDAHVEFTRRPDCGPNSDNIWTSNGTGGPNQQGTVVATGTVGTFGVSAAPFDVVMVPIADVGTGARK